MFKRVEKKLAKKKEEEELGITEEIKEAIGLNDVDESDDSTSEASSSGSTPQIPSKRKRSPGEDLGDDSDSAFGGHGSGASEDSGDDEDELDVQMTVEEVLHNPFFIVSIQPDVRGCIVCSRKILKNDTMVSVHTRSQAHQRRMSKFKEVAASAEKDDDAREILSIAFPPTPLLQKSPSNDSAPLSKRAAKRVAKFEEMKTKRRKHKEAKARSIAARAAKKVQTKVGSESKTTDVALTSGPPKKKLESNNPPSRMLASERPLPTKQQPGDLLDGGGPKRQGRSQKESKVTDAKVNQESKRIETGKKRKECDQRRP